MDDDRAMTLYDGTNRLILEEVNGRLTIITYSSRTGQALHFSVSAKFPDDLSNAQGLANFVAVFLKKHGITV